MINKSQSVINELPNINVPVNQILQYVINHNFKCHLSGVDCCQIRTNNKTDRQQS